jgi:hypothetical protein
MDRCAAGKADRLRALCKDYNCMQASTCQWHEIVRTSYELRYGDSRSSQSVAVDYDKVMKPRYMLGWLSANHEVFEEPTVQYKALANLKMDGVALPCPKEYPSPSLNECGLSLTDEPRL